MQAIRLKNRVREALEWYREDPNRSLREAELKFSVARLTILKAHYQQPTRATRLHTNAKLLKNQERTLELYILGL